MKEPPSECLITVSAFIDNVRHYYTVVIDFVVIIAYFSFASSLEPFQGAIIAVRFTSVTGTHQTDIQNRKEAETCHNFSNSSFLSSHLMCLELE